jgi:cell division protein FtsB
VLLPRVLGVPVLTVALLTFATAVVLGNYLPTMADGAATLRAVERRQGENFALARRIRALESEAAALESDPWLNERILRDELRMTRPGEVPVR